MVQWVRIWLPVQGTHTNHLSGRIPQAAERLNPRATTTEARVLQGPWSATGRATASRTPCTTTRQSPLLAATRENPCTATKTQHSKTKQKANDKKIPRKPGGFIEFSTLDHL